MDIISHTLTGVALGTVTATVSNKNWKKKALLIFLGGLGGALPDFDAISLWSKFDKTFGILLNLKHSGKEIYFGKFWYSHHAALHSVLAPIIFILFFIILIALRKRFQITDILESLKNVKLFFIAFFTGFIFHLLEDMPTPASVWGGVNLFYPSSKYIGGFGKIWWWNNYDLVLIIITVIFINLLLNCFPKQYHTYKSKASITVFSIGCFIFLYQINTRTIDFSYTGHTTKYAQFEKQSKQIQKEILGEKLFNIMTTIDNKISLNF